MITNITLINTDGRGIELGGTFKIEMDDKTYEEKLESIIVELDEDPLLIEYKLEFETVTFTASAEITDLLYLLSKENKNCYLDDFEKKVKKLLRTNNKY